MIPSYIQFPKRQEVSRRWLEAKAAKRIARGVDAETLRSRALHDARGTVEREGCTYRASGITRWQVRRAVAGRTDQFEFIANGRVKLLGGPRRFPLAFRP